MDSIIWIGLNVVGLAGEYLEGMDNQLSNPTQRMKSLRKIDTMYSGNNLKAAPPPPAPVASPAPAPKSAPKAETPAPNQSVHSQNTQGSPTLRSKKSEAEDQKDELKPNRKVLNEKEKQIANGQVRNKQDYPTFNDIASDWESDKGNDDKDKKSSKNKKQSKRSKRSKKSNNKKDKDTKMKNAGDLFGEMKEKEQEEKKLNMTQEEKDDDDEKKEVSKGSVRETQEGSKEAHNEKE